MNVTFCYAVTDSILVAGCNKYSAALIRDMQGSRRQVGHILSPWGILRGILRGKLAEDALRYAGGHSRCSCCARSKSELSSDPASCTLGASEPLTCSRPFSSLSLCLSASTSSGRPLAGPYWSSRPSMARAAACAIASAGGAQWTIP